MHLPYGKYVEKMLDSFKNRYRYVLTPKTPIMTKVDIILQYVFHYFSKEIRLDISCEFSANSHETSNLNFFE